MDMLKSLASWNSRKGIEFVNLEDAADVGSCSQVHFSGKRNLNHLFSGLGHDFLNTSMDDILLSGALKHLLFADGQPSGLIDDVQQVVLGLLLPLARHPSGIDVL
jgi:hypothetical protein